MCSVIEVAGQWCGLPCWCYVDVVMVGLFFSYEVPWLSWEEGRSGASFSTVGQIFHTLNYQNSLLSNSPMLLMSYAVFVEKQ